MLRMMIVTTSPQLEATLPAALRRIPQFASVACVDPRGAMEAALARSAPDLVLVDGIDDLSATAVLRRVRARTPETKVVLLAVDTTSASISSALQSGADAVIARSTPLGTLAILLHEIFRGTVYHRVTQRAAQGPHELLTPRELDVLRLTAQGAPNAGIAAQLFVSEQTVKYHLTNVYRKLGVANRTEASRYAMVHGLLEADEWASHGQLAAA